MKISMIIPAYNEEKRIGKTLEEYGKFFDNLKKNSKIDYEILVVINNTRDRTEDIVKEYSKKYKKIRYINLEQGGKGFAIIQGFKNALERNNDLIGFVDADMATSPEAFFDLMVKINNFDGIIGSRYVKGAIVSPRQSLQRIFVSRVFNIVIRGLFLMPYVDTQCGAKIFKKEAIASIINELGMSQWAFDVELLYLLDKRGFKIKEQATIWADKEYSKINFIKAGPKMVLSVVRLRLLNSQLEPLLRPLRMIAKFGDSLINR